MRSLKNLLIIGFLGLVLGACTDHFADLNTNTKSPSKVAGETLFTNAEVTLVDQISSTSVNLNIWKLWAQYWTETTYTDEANFDIFTRKIPDNTFSTYYAGVLKDLAEAKRVISETEDIDAQAKENKLAIADLLEVYSYQRLVDIFGNIPYSEALTEGVLSPKYDDAATIYADLFTRVNADISVLADGGASYGDADLIYGGNTALWLKFAYGLKLKLAIHLADVAGSGAQAAAEAAASGVFSSSNDDALLVYTASSPNTNPIYEDLVLSGRADFVAANTIVNTMNTLNDPRRDEFFGANLGAGVFTGGVYGASSPYANYSHVGDIFHIAELPGFLMTYTEIQFYLAEAAARGWSVGGTAAAFYAEGVTSSILEWGGDAADVTGYLAQPSVAWATAAGTDLQKVAAQAWLGAYSRGFLGYTTWRRLDYPSLAMPPNAEVGSIPVRFTYPVNEQTLNKANFTAAATAIGGDDLLTKIFWDKN